MKSCVLELFLMFLSPGQPYGGSEIAKMSTVGQAICKKASTHSTGTQLIFVGCQGPSLFLKSSLSNLHLTKLFVLLKWLPWLIASLSHQPCMFTLTCLSAEFQMLIDINNFQFSWWADLYATLLTHWRFLKKVCYAWR